MIKLDELREFRPQVRYQDGMNITLKVVEDAIRNCADKMGIPVAFYPEEIKMGGLFSSIKEECLVMYHPQHRDDYFKFCIRIRRQGSYAFVTINDFGKSKLITKEGASEGAYAGAASTGGLSGVVVGAVVKSILKPNKSKLEDEKNYYQCVFDIFDEIVS